MEQVLQFFRVYEIWIYIILGVLILWQIRKFVLSGKNYEEHVWFRTGLAQSRVNSAAHDEEIIIMAVAEFTIVTFVSDPPVQILPTATLDFGDSTFLTPINPQPEATTTRGKPGCGRV
jgi:hypothetical protein